MDRKGRLSLDMLIGLSIFLVTFIFIAQFLPTVFADVRSEIGLAHEAYKVTVMLAETEGAWSNGTHNGTNWEDYESQWGDTDFVFLPGLTEGEPDYLEFDKLKALQNATENYYNKVREMLGLLTPDRNYNFHVSLESLDSKPYNRTLVTDRDGNVVLDAGADIPSSGYISRYERNVWVNSVYDLVGAYYIGTAGPRNVPNLCRVNVDDIDCNFTYPLRFFAIEVFGKENDPTNVWWLGVCLQKTGTPSSCNAKPDTIQVGYGSPLTSSNVKWEDTLAVKTYELTTILNNIMRDEGFSDGDTVYIKIGIHNTNATLYYSGTIDYLAGKAVAKLVVYVW
ncbi:MULTISPECIES: hypothetical protein [unclassified Archaeoglobus]|jgi:hypothetical protein|uniref:hypothetical protein n=1 Tax=unclassified Archaeoglobus TaxID=2643606 RepID=UPI0025C1430E|nr:MULTISPECIES: hypothetical protein [unclassified Archaeoglobus]